jgi:hypothetical protein
MALSARWYAASSLLAARVLGYYFFNKMAV